MKSSYDVIVIGGGSAGISAAVQAGRAGARTLLVEKAAMLGGTTTSGGVNFPGLFHAWGNQVIKGIGWEIVEESVRISGGKLPDFSNYKRPHHLLQIRVNAFVYAALCDQKVSEAGVDLLFHTMLAGIEKSGDDWSVTLCTKDGLSQHQAKIIIDCSGDANAARLAGFELVIPEENQPATLSCKASGYDFDSLDVEAINAAYELEVKAGRLSYTDVSWNTQAAHVAGWLRSGGANASHIHDINARNSEGRSALELAARESLLRLYRFFRQQPGLENIVIESVSPECGVRETATIKGKATVSEEDYRSGRLWEDALSYSFYPIDLHKSSGGGLRCEPLQEGTVPTIPRAAMLPAGSRNFIVAGRCISSDRLANSALRVQASCMGMGQAAGAMAALGAKENLDPEKLELDAIRQLLRDHQAIVPGTS